MTVAVIHTGVCRGAVDLAVRSQIVSYRAGQRIEADDHMRGLLDHAGAAVDWDKPLAAEPEPDEGEGGEGEGEESDGADESEDVAAHPADAEVDPAQPAPDAPKRRGRPRKSA